MEFVVVAKIGNSRNRIHSREQEVDSASVVVSKQPVLEQRTTKRRASNAVHRYRICYFVFDLLGQQSA